MRTKILSLIAILILFGIVLTACGGTVENAEPAPAATEASLEPTLSSPTDTSLPPTTETSASATVESSGPPATEPGAAPQASVSFVNDVLPIFESRCIKCHGGDETKEGLDLKTHASLMAGSKNGSVLTPGNSNDSLLVKQLLEGEMPKRGPKLTPDQIQIIVGWVNAGAADN